MTKPDDELTPRLQLAIAAAQTAGDLTLEYFRRADLDVERKSDDSPVTVADREAERKLREVISREFPDDGIFGEEFHNDVGQTARDFGVEFTRHPGSSSNVRMNQLKDIGGFKRKFADKQFIQGHAQRIKIRAPVNRSVHSAGLLGRHIRQRSSQHLDFSHCYDIRQGP